MFRGITIIGLGLALSAAPAWGQMGHMYNHQGQESGNQVAADSSNCPVYGMAGYAGMMGMPGVMGVQGARGMMGVPYSRGMGTWSGNMAEVGGMPMMGGRFPAPQFLLAMREDLNLSPDQVRALEQLQAGAYEKAQEEMDVAQRQAPEFDPSAELNGQQSEEYIQGLRNYMAHMTEARIAMVQAGIEARNLLTPDQRDQLEEALGSWGRMGPQRGMMMGGFDHGHAGHHPGSSGTS